MSTCKHHEHYNAHGEHLHSIFVAINNAHERELIDVYTPDQTSKMLKIPLSTLRRYASQYSEHLSEHTKRRKRRYTEQDITTLARARELLSSGKSPSEVNKLLSVITTDEQLPDNTLALIPSISQALAQALDTAQTLRADVDQHDKRLNETESKLLELSNRLDELVSAKNTPWYKKLFRRAG
jgi:DNA-binding transcriptional MerR regulator